MCQNDQFKESLEVPISDYLVIRLANTEAQQDLVIFMIEALNKLNQQEIIVETTDNLVDALGGVFPVTIFYTARDFADAPEVAVALLANFYREGDDLLRGD